MNYTSILTNIVRMVTLLENIFHISFAHIHLNRLSTFSNTVYGHIIFSRRKRATCLGRSYTAEHFMCPDVSGSRRWGAKDYS